MRIFCGSESESLALLFLAGGSTAAVRRSSKIACCRVGDVVVWRMMTFVVSCQHEDVIFNGYCNHFVDFLVLRAQHKHRWGDGGVVGGLMTSIVDCSATCFLLARLLLCIVMIVRMGGVGGWGVMTFVVDENKTLILIDCSCYVTLTCTRMSR